MATAAGWTGPNTESVAAVNGWNDKEKLLWLRVRLVGRAATAFKRVPEGAKASYARCLEALKERFDPSSKRELYLTELMGRKKLRSEDWATFAEDLKQLVERMYPDLQEDAREQLALTHYLGQQENQQLAFSMKQRRPKIVDETVSATLEMESYLLPKGSRVAQVAEGYMPIEPVLLVHGQNDAQVVTATSWLWETISPNGWKPMPCQIRKLLLLRKSLLMSSSAGSLSPVAYTQTKENSLSPK